MHQKISVVIPTHREDWKAQRAIDSVFTQTLRPHEVIVSLDGVSGETLNLEGCKVVSHKKGSAAGSRNEGIKKATGEYIAFLDSDDVWLKEKLETQMQKPYADVILCDCCANNRYYSLNYTPIKQQLLHRLVTGTLMKTTPGLVIRRSLLFDIGLYDEDMRRNEDHLLLYRALSQNASHQIIRKALWKNRGKGITNNTRGYDIIKYNLLMLRKTRHFRVKTVIELVLRTFPYAIYTDLKRMLRR